MELEPDLSETSFLFDCAYLGRFHIIDIYVWYDGPRIFSCYNNGIYYFGYWCQSSNYGKIESFCLIPSSTEKLDKIRNKQMDINTALSQHEQDYFFIVNLDYNKDLEFETVILYNSNNMIDLFTLPKHGIMVH